MIIQDNTIQYNTIQYNKYNTIKYIFFHVFWEWGSKRGQMRRDYVRKKDIPERNRSRIEILTHPLREITQNYGAHLSGRVMRHFVIYHFFHILGWGGVGGSEGGGLTCILDPKDRDLTCLLDPTDRCPRKHTKSLHGVLDPPCKDPRK